MGLRLEPDAVLRISASNVAADLRETPKETPSASCWSQADKKGAHGEARTNFQKPCVGGVMAPTSSSYNDADARAAKAAAAPSAADQAARSQTCAAAADDKGHDQSQRNSIRSDCMAADATPAGAASPPPAQSPAPPPAADPLQPGVAPHSP